MVHQITGRLRWDTTHAATPGWLLFLEGQPADLLTMRPWLETHLPAEASAADITHLIGELLHRDTGQLPAQVQAFSVFRRNFGRQIVYSLAYKRLREW